MAQLSEHVQRVEARVDEFVPRRSITETVKRKHREAVSALGGRCPCCGVNEVMDEQDRVIGEYDHFYSRERRGFEDVWLICKECHRSEMRDRHNRAAEFTSYQRKAKAICEGQLSLLA